MRKFILAGIISIWGLQAAAQYPPAAGQPGSTAIHADSSCFVAWATHCIVDRGYVNLSDTNITAGGSNRASYGIPADAVGKANNSVVSLGDKGVAILTFEFPLVNGPGWDFAVFENGLNDLFLELAFVEVSSNGIDFFRFPSVSLTQTDIQTGSFGETDPTKINNLAGKYRVMYGTPFDLDELDEDPLIDRNHITHMKIIDVGGSVNPLYASWDYPGNIINDPFPTPFESCGFDLDAVGVINNTQTFLQSNEKSKIHVYPNPASETICLPMQDIENEAIQMYNAFGQLVSVGGLSSNCLDITHLPQGMYFLRIEKEDGATYTSAFYKL